MLKRPLGQGETKGSTEVDNGNDFLQEAICREDQWDFGLRGTDRSSAEKGSTLEDARCKARGKSAANGSSAVRRGWLLVSLSEHLMCLRSACKQLSSVPRMNP